MKRILLFGIIAAAAFGSMNAEFTPLTYRQNSALSSGKWVKIGVEKTGVYEISYATLREMGFSDPSKVSVYGKGGTVLPESFISNSGLPTLSDDLSPVKIIHENNTLYFYGLGPEEISFESSTGYSTGGYFSRKSNNIYSRRGYYFLTDSRDVAPMETKDYYSPSYNKIETGVSYLYHELDSVQNTTQSGQLFWGESVNRPGATRRYWDVSMPDAIAGSGVMECVMYFQGYDFGSGAKVLYGFDNNPFTISYKANTALYYAPHQPTVAEITVPGESGKVMVGFDNPNDMGEFANLDFWVLSYQRTAPSMKNTNGSQMNQELIALPTVTKNVTFALPLPNAASLVALDVTKPDEPQRLTLTLDEANGNYLASIKTSSSKTPVIAIFDKDQPQLQISGYEEAYTQIANQNLHEYSTTGADFVIVSTPAFRQYAEEIARLHRLHDNIEVIVTTPEECYNEFSAGTPDPMAIRAFLRMLYTTDRKPKNVLLMGPLYGDFRGLQSEHNPMEGIIAYQSPSISISRGAHNINDFYGMMSDKFRTDYYERNEVQIGVGIIPLKFESEAKIIVEKIKNFLERDDHAYYQNLYTAIGGIGDNHTHDSQIKDIQDHFDKLHQQGIIITPLAIDTYGNAEARKKFLNQINSGGIMFSYFGHGGEQSLGQNNKFFTAGDVYNLRNKILPLALFGGCQITNTDRGFRGLGETIVTGTPYGCVGSIVSARDTWSGQNYEFFKQFFTCLYHTGSTPETPLRENPVTIGEIYASVKTYSTYSNELAYQLMCDPALIIPVTNRQIILQEETGEIHPGEKHTFKGRITRLDGNTDREFNGQLVLRLNEPEKTLGAGCIESGEDPKGLAFRYMDTQLGMAVTDVTEGCFEVTIHIPSSVATFRGNDALLFFSAYNPTSRTAAAQRFKATVTGMQENAEELADNIPPTIELLEFNDEDCSISLYVSDNLALNMSNGPLNKGLYLYIDGTERTEVHFIQPVLEKDRAAFGKEVLIEGLSYGEHTAHLKVKDAAGNTAEQEILFTYNPLQAKYQIAKDEDNSQGNLTLINIEGETPAKYHIVILSSEGNEVWRGEFSGSTAEWDHTILTGEKAPAGHYKAYLIETGEGYRKGHSNTIDIPVI